MNSLKCERFLANLDLSACSGNCLLPMHGIFWKVEMNVFQLELIIGLVLYEWKDYTRGKLTLTTFFFCFDFSLFYNNLIHGITHPKLYWCWEMGHLNQTFSLHEWWILWGRLHCMVLIFCVLILYFLFSFCGGDSEC